MNEWRSRVALTLTAAVSAAALVLAGWALYARFEQSNANREANKMVWHAVICRIEAAVAKEPLTPEKRRQALLFYDHLLTQQVQTTGCGLR